MNWLYFLLMRTVIRLRWELGYFYRQGVYLKPFLIEGEGSPYETYMVAWPVKADIGKIGELIIKFPPGAAEDNQLHTHPSARIVEVLEGEGIFEAVRRGKNIRIHLRKGDRVYMPVHILHTFWASTSGPDFTVRSWHFPYDDQRINYPLALTDR